MQLIDYILLILLLVAFVRGMINGLLKEIASLLAIVLGIVVARLFNDEVSAYLTKWFDISQIVASICSFTIIFLIVAIGLHCTAHLLKKFLSLLSLNWLNRIAGGLFGTFKIALILSLVLNICSSLDKYVVIFKPEVKQSSALYQPIEKLIPTILPFTKSWDYK